MRPLRNSPVEPVLDGQALRLHEALARSAILIDESQRLMAEALELIDHAQISKCQRSRSMLMPTAYTRHDGPLVARLV